MEKNLSKRDKLLALRLVSVIAFLQTMYLERGIDHISFHDMYDILCDVPGDDQISYKWCVGFFTQCWSDGVVSNLQYVPDLIDRIRLYVRQWDGFSLDDFDDGGDVSDDHA